MDPVNNNLIIPSSTEPMSDPPLSLDAANFIFECLEANKASSLKTYKRFKHVNKVYYYAHGCLNDFIALARSFRKLSEIWHTFSNGITFAFDLSKFMAFGSTPDDIVDLVDNVKGVVYEKELPDKAASATEIVATLGNILLNTWTFIQGLSTVTKISQLAIQAFDIIGPVGWGINTLCLIKVGRDVYKDSQFVNKIKALTPTKDAGDINRFAMFKLFLLDDVGHKVKHSDLMDKFRLMGRIPFIEPKKKIRCKIEAIAKQYLLTQDKKVTNQFVKLVRSQFRMNNFLFSLKAISVLAGLGALLCFYLPGLNTLPMTNIAGWSFLIISGSVGVSLVLLTKINSLLFLRQLAEQAKKNEEKIKQDYEVLHQRAAITSRTGSIVQKADIDQNP